jgi:uncharacterized membrane protein YgcG
VAVDIGEGRIKIAVETGAAQDAVGKLADSTKGMARAIDGASTTVKDLAKQQVALTRIVTEAREAVDRLRRAEAEAKAVTEAFGKDSREAAEAMARLKAAQEAATRAAKAQEEALKQTRLAAAHAAAEADGKTTPAIKRLGTALERASKDAERTATDLRTLEARMESASRGATGFGGAMASFKGNLAANAVAFLGSKVSEAGLYMLETASNVERLKTALATTLGSQQAASAEFERLQQFAAATPFSLQEVADSFIKLKNRGLDSSQEAMKAYGDTAGAMGKTLNDVVEAVADATQGEGERLKEFGINMHKAGDQVSLTFRGVTQTMKFEAKNIEQYLINLGQTNFTGGMEAQSKTLGGMWSTMKDGLDMFIVSVMDSGITDGLKSMMSAFSGMGETGGLLADILGVTLGTAFEVLGVGLELVLPLVDLLAEGLRYVVAPAVMAKEALAALGGDLADEFTKPIMEAAAAQEALRLETVAMLSSGPAGGQVSDLLDSAVPYANALLSQANAHLAAARAADEQSQAEARLQAKFDKAAAKEADRELEESFQMGPELPKDYKKPSHKKGKKKKVKDTSREQSLGGAESFEKHDRFVRESAFAASAQAYEDEQRLRATRIEGMGAEIAALEAKAERERESVDMIFFTVQVESDAARARDALIDERMRKEMELAQWEVRNAKTREQRERAQTRVFEAESKKRALAVQREVAAEAKEHARREQIVGKVTSAVTTLGEGMISAFERMAAGEKGAMAQMLADLLKGVAKKHAILALGEFASGVGSQAATFGIPNPKSIAHFTAGGMHLGVAAAAGIGAFVAGQAADSRAGTGDYARGGGGSGGSGFGRGTGGGSGSGGSSGGGGDDDGLDAQEVPVSHEQLRRGSPSGARKSGGAAVVISGTVNIYGAGGKREFIDDILKGIDRANRGGRRPRI